jgi:hypothetical protein
MKVKTLMIALAVKGGFKLGSTGLAAVGATCMIKQSQAILCHINLLLVMQKTIANQVFFLLWKIFKELKLLIYATKIT